MPAGATACSRRVAPHAGAWIETGWPEWWCGGFPSPLTRGRGSKPRRLESGKRLLRVAPHAGAWIETFHGLPRAATHPVAPHAGAWIETQKQQLLHALHASPLTRGRGSKRDRRGSCQVSSSRPSRGGVDRNSASSTTTIAGPGRPSRGGVDRNQNGQLIVG